MDVKFDMDIEALSDVEPEVDDVSVEDEVTDLNDEIKGLSPDELKEAQEEYESDFDAIDPLDSYLDTLSKEELLSLRNEITGETTDVDDDDSEDVKVLTMRHRL